MSSLEDQTNSIVDKMFSIGTNIPVIRSKFILKDSHEWVMEQLRKRAEVLVQQYELRLRQQTEISQELSRARSSTSHSECAKSETSNDPDTETEIARQQRPSLRIEVANRDEAARKNMTESQPVEPGDDNIRKRKRPCGAEEVPCKLLCDGNDQNIARNSQGRHCSSDEAIQRLSKVREKFFGSNLVKIIGETLSDRAWRLSAEDYHLKSSAELGNK